MLARFAAISCGTALLLPATAQQRPREHFQNAEIFYDWVSNSRGDKLRTFITRPPGRARYVEVDGMTHGFSVDGKFDANIVSTILNWAKEQMAGGK